MFGVGFESQHFDFDLIKGFSVDRPRVGIDALGAEKERLRILVSRLDDEAVAARCLSDLVSSVIADTSGYGSPSKIDAATGAACKKAWERFLDQHGEALASGKRFKLADPAVPLKDLFPGYTFYPKAPER